MYSFDCVYIPYLYIVVTCIHILLFYLYIPYKVDIHQILKDLKYSLRPASSKPTFEWMKCTARRYTFMYLWMLVIITNLLYRFVITTFQHHWIWTIDRIYAYRPDLLAFDLYGTPRLWWVFAQRNPNEIEDPIYDFKPGVTIQLPKLTTLQNDLGI